MKNKLLIALTLTACTGSMHAAITLTKARTLAQAATTYASTNNLKTAGMVIGGFIVLDAARAAGYRAYRASELKRTKQRRDLELKEWDHASNAGDESRIRCAKAMYELTNSIYEAERNSPWRTTLLYKLGRKHTNWFD
jgi:hypothetical protein